jgi:hypothetical protein
MNNKNNDLNKIKFKTLSTPKNYNKNNLTLQNEILKINDIIKTKFFLPKLEHNIKKDFLDLKNSTIKLNNDFQNQSLEIKNSIKSQKIEIYKLSNKKNIQSDILKNQKLLIEEQKINENKLQFTIEKLKKKLENINSSNKNFLINNAELKNTIGRYIKHNKNLQNNITQLKQAQVDALLDKSQIEEMSQQIKFYQDDNVRLSNKIINIQKKYEVIKHNFDSSEKEKDMIFKKIQNLNNSITNANIIGTPYLKEHVQENSINSKVLNDITNKNLKDEKIKPKENKDLDDQINNIFK